MIQYGVKSTFSADRKLTNGYDFFHWVIRRRTVPTFWMRNLTGENSLTIDETMFLKENGCKIGLFLNELSERKVSSRDGTFEAMLAVEAAKALGVPRYAGIAIFAEIQSEWSINHNWMIGFAKLLCERGFVPGFIGNTDSSKNFIFDRECGHYIHATGDVNHYCAVYGATEPSAQALENGWTPFAPSDLSPEKIGLWCNDKKIVFRDMIAETIYARDEAVMNCFW